MTVDFSTTMLWTLAVLLSGIMAALLIDTTLQRKHSGWITAAGWTLTIAAAFVASGVFYLINITEDTAGIMGTSLFLCIAAAAMYREHAASKWFISIMAALMANTTTFFFCGTTLSFIDNAPNPYNAKTILTFIGIKLVWFTIMYILYRLFLRKIIVIVIGELGSRAVGYLPVSVVSFVGFYLINMLTNHLGIFPAVPGMRYIFIGFYTIICSIFVLEYWQIFTSVFWSSRAMKTEAELNVASTIQKNMLPSVFPAFPNLRSFDIFATMLPAKEVGGDFYDFFLIDDTHLAIVIADVSGKGVPAALFMVIAKTLIKNVVQQGKSPKEVFEIVNNRLCENNEASMFVTAFLGVVDITDGKFTYVNAGHNPPLLKRADGRFGLLPVKRDFVLAGMENVKYRETETTLRGGDMLYLYTDGVTEAINRTNLLYSEVQLLADINKHRERSPEELLTCLKTDIDDFVNGAEQFDDITMLALQINEVKNTEEAAS